MTTTKLHIVQHSNAKTLTQLAIELQLQCQAAQSDQCDVVVWAVEDPWPCLNQDKPAIAIASELAIRGFIATVASKEASNWRAATGSPLHAFGHKIYALVKNQPRPLTPSEVYLRHYVFFRPQMQFFEPPESYASIDPHPFDLLTKTPEKLAVSGLPA